MKKGYAHMKCGLLGEHLSHSYSPLIHSKLADYSYELYEVSKDNLADFLKNGEVDAFNVTIPYKKAVIPYLDSISPEAEAIGSVNTVIRDKNNRLHGYNTDYFGFSYMVDLLKIDVADKKALVLGAGGASLTVCKVLRDRGAKEITVLGSKDNTPEAISLHSDAEIVVNATPVGMYPNNGASPIDLSLLKNCRAVFDLIFNPSLTALLMQAEELGIPYINGLPMLVAQAAKACSFFTEETFDNYCIEEITREIDNKTKNIILIGMPGCGKSTVGRLISEKTEMTFFDADREFEKDHGFSPAYCIEQMGEGEFRRRETETIKNLCKKSGAVIATGGGVVTRSENYPPLHQNGVIFFIERELDNLTKKGRPLSQKTSPEQMYASRIKAYKKFADVIIYSNEIIEDTANKIISEFEAFIGRKL